MKCLVLSGIMPTKEDKNASIFINKRLDEYLKLNIDFEVFSLVTQESKIVNFIKRKLLGKANIDHEINYDFGKYKWNIIHVRKKLLDRFNKNRIIERKLKAIEENINILEFDLIVVHWAYPEGYLASMIKEKYELPYVLTLHGSDIHTLPLESEIFKRKIGLALENADMCIFVSNKLRDEAIGMGYGNMNSIVINNGYDNNIFNLKDKNLAKSKVGLESKYVIGYVGNLIDVKNVLVLPKIFQLIKDKILEVQFVIIGDGELKTKLLEMLDLYGINYIFTGRLMQENVAQYMQAMDALILPSKKEGYGLVLLEAQACGTFVVGSDVGGISEAIGNTEQVFKLNHDFEHNIANKIVAELLKGIDNDYISRRVRSFTWKDIAHKEVEVFNNINNNKYVIRE